MQADLVLDHATLLTIDSGPDGPLAGAQQSDLGRVDDAALAISGGRIVALGPREAVLPGLTAATMLDLAHRVVLPGLVDAHSHPVWAGSRASELELRVRGATYLEIMAAGGGIQSTVDATRAAATATLVADTSSRLDELMVRGVTTVEAKSGYGLDVEEELRQLSVLAEVARQLPTHIVPTFLGAHAVPPAFHGRSDAYVELVVDEMLPRVAKVHPGIFCDVFCDDGAFNLDQTRRILTAARDLGLPTKVHADEFANLGASTLAAELGCVSADHLVATRLEEMAALARSGTVAVLLPGTTFGLGSTHFADARAMVAQGVSVALGSDLNPGTCPSPDLPLVLAIAVRYLRLSPAEAIVAATRNAAHAVGRGDVAGRLAAGRPADLTVLDAVDHRELGYAFGSNPMARVMIDGRWVAIGGRTES